MKHFLIYCLMSCALMLTANSLLTLFGQKGWEYNYVATSDANEPAIMGRTAAEASITLYPNPAQNQIQLSGVTGTYTLTLTNALTGQTAFTKTAIAEESISLQGLRKGLYFYTISQRGILKKGTLSVE